MSGIFKGESQGLHSLFATGGRGIPLVQLACVSAVGSFSNLVFFIMAGKFRVICIGLHAGPIRLNNINQRIIGGSTCSALVSRCFDTHERAKKLIEIVSLNSVVRRSRRVGILSV